MKELNINESIRNITPTVINSLLYFIKFIEYSSELKISLKYGISYFIADDMLNINLGIKIITPQTIK